MAISREPEPVEDRWLEQTESKAVRAEARINGNCTKAVHGALLHQFSRHLQWQTDTVKAEYAKAAEI